MPSNLVWCPSAYRKFPLDGNEDDRSHHQSVADTYGRRLRDRRSAETEQKYRRIIFEGVVSVWRRKSNWVLEQDWSIRNQKILPIAFEQRLASASRGKLTEGHAGSLNPWQKYIPLRPDHDITKGKDWQQKICDGLLFLWGYFLDFDDNWRKKSSWKWKRKIWF